MAFTYTGTQVDLAFGRGWLNAPAAASIRRIDRQIGHALQITEAGRTWAQQDAHYQRFLRYGSPIALSPNTPSLHQKGNAVDTNEGQRIHAVMEDHGWRRTVYRWVNGVWTLIEPWHYEYFEHLDNHRHEGAASGGAVSEEDMTPEQDALLRNVAAFIFGGGTSTIDPKYFGGTGSLYNRIRNIEAHLYAGGVDAAKDSYLGAPGTIYSLLKTPVDREIAGKVVKVPQIQELADTKTIAIRSEAKLEALAARPAASISKDQVQLIAELVAKQIGKPTMTLDYGAIAKAVNDDTARRLAG